MSRCPRNVLRLVQNRALSTVLPRQQSNFSNSSTAGSLRTPQTPSQILRLLLIDDHTKVPDSRPADQAPLLGLSNPPAKTQAIIDLKDVSDLEGLRIYVEGHAEESQIIEKLSSDTLDAIFSKGYSSREILVCINALILRFASRPELVSSLHALGLRYASKCLSIPALNHHLDGWCESTSDLLSISDSIAVVGAIREALHATRYAYSSYDPKALLGLIAEEGSHSSSYKHRLRDILQFPGGFDPKLIDILGYLGAKESLFESWDLLKSKLGKEHSRGIVESGYELVIAFLDLNMVPAAQNCLSEVSSRTGNQKPSTHTLDRVLSALVRHNAALTLKEEVAVALFSGRLDEVENRLGVRWQADSSSHSGMGDLPFDVHDHGIITSGGEDAVLTSLRRLAAEVNALATSHSRLQLAVMADLLDELAGCEIPLFSQTTGHGVWQYAWFPERSPIEFSNSLSQIQADISEVPSPAYLGLIRARLDRHGQPLPLDSERHLMQFGKLLARQCNAAKDAVGSASDNADDWIDSGYILALDRMSLDYVLLFVGRNQDIIEPGLPTETVGSFGQLVTLPKLDVSDGIGYNRIVSDDEYKSWTSRGKFHLDVDPLFDLKEKQKGTLKMSDR